MMVLHKVGILARVVFPGIEVKAASAFKGVQEEQIGHEASFADPTSNSPDVGASCSVAVGGAVEDEDRTGIAAHKVEALEAGDIASNEQNVAELVEQNAELAAQNDRLKTWLKASKAAGAELADQNINLKASVKASNAPQNAKLSKLESEVGITQAAFQS